MVGVSKGLRSGPDEPSEPKQYALVPRILYTKDYGTESVGGQVIVYVEPPHPPRVKIKLIPKSPLKSARVSLADAFKAWELP
jgi:hypothetical protein